MPAIYDKRAKAAAHAHSSNPWPWSNEPSLESLLGDDILSLLLAADDVRPLEFILLIQTALSDG